MQKNNNLFVKLKEDKGARGIAITITVMILVLTAIIVTTVIANRAAKEQQGDPLGGGTQVGVNDPDDTPDDIPSEKPNETPSEKPDTGAGADVLPEKFLLPVSGVLQKSHDATIQVFSPTMGDYRLHLGIDIGTTAGATVSAMADGVIAQIWEDRSMGQCVAIKHGGDAYTIYKNLSAELPAGLKEGTPVKAGDVIGSVGESAQVEIGDEPHLHVEMTVGGLQVDPTDYLDEDAKATLGEDTNYEDVS